MADRTFYQNKLKYHPKIAFLKRIILIILVDG